MIVPGSGKKSMTDQDRIDRWGLFNELTQQCFVSRDSRRGIYERLRSYYLWGCDAGGNPALYNKILPQMDLLSAFMFAAETTRFGIQLGESCDKKAELPKVAALTALINNKWHDSECDIQFGQALLWSFVFGTMFLKLIVRNKRIIPYLADPHSVGVLREDFAFLDDQDAFAHKYTVSASALPRLLEAHPRKEQIMKSVSRSMGSEASDMPAGLSRIVMSSFPMVGAPSGQGTAPVPYSTQYGYRAQTSDERVELTELWVWDDEANDYTVATIAGGGVVIFDRPNFYLPGEHPFVQVRPNPSYDYFWGHSEVDKLTSLQDYREARMAQIQDLLSRQVKPATSMRGMWQGIPDEVAFAYNMFGGGMASQDASADFKAFFPTVPPDTFVEIRAIDEMFNEMTGLSNITQGKGEAGVRSKGQTTELARLGSARIKKRALIIEDPLDEVGTKYLKLIQQHEDMELRDESGGKFIAEQFTKDAIVKVDAHSSSPIFVEDQKKLAFDLFEAKVIDGEELLQMTDPPGKQRLASRYKEMQAAMAKQAAQQHAAEGESPGAKK